MAQQVINVGSGENAGDGESLRSSMLKINANTNDAYAHIADRSNPHNVTVAQIGAVPASAINTLIATLDGNGKLAAGQTPSLVLEGDVAGTPSDGTLVATLAPSGVTAGTFTQVVVNAKGLVTSGAALTATGDATGAAAGSSIALTLAPTGVAEGTYNTVTVNAKGLVTMASNAAYVTGNQSVTVSGDATGSGTADITLTLANSGAMAGTYSAVTINAKGLVTSGANLTATGDATGTASGSSIALTLPSTGVAPGTYNSLTVNAKGLVTSASTASYVPTSALGAANGVATLDASGKVPLSQLAASIVGAVNYQGTWDPATNTPTLVSGAGSKGDYYKASGSGGTPIDGNSQWNAGDTIIFDGATWDKIDGISSEVVSVNGMVGAVSVTTITGNAGSASRLAAPVSVTLDGDATGLTAFDGSGPATLTATLAASGATAGTYNTVVVNAKGLVTSASNAAYLSGNQAITLSGDATGSGTNAIAITLAASGATAGTYSALAVNAKGLVTSGANLTATGDATGTASGSGIALALAPTGVAEGTYNTLAVNAKGLVTSASTVNYLTSNQTITVSGDATGSGVSAITLSLADSGATAGTYSALAVNAKGLVTSGANLTATGDVTGTASGASIGLTLAATGVTAGTYNTLVVNAKGLVTSAANIANANQTITVSGDATGSGASAITLTLAASGAAAGTYSALAVNAKGLVTSGANLTATGDATGTASGASIGLTLAPTGVAAGTYNTVTVNAKGLVVAASVTTGQSAPGTTMGDNAAAGTVGEYVYAIVYPGSGTSLASGNAASVATLALAAGDWAITGSVTFTPAASTAFTAIEAGIGGATNFSSTYNGGLSQFNLPFTTGKPQTISCGESRLSSTASTVVHLLAQSTFANSTMEAAGFLCARRVR